MLIGLFWYLSLITRHFPVRKSASAAEFSRNQLLCWSIFKWTQEGVAERDVSKAFSWCYWYSKSWWSESAGCSCSPSRSSWGNSSWGRAGRWSWGILPLLLDSHHFMIYAFLVSNIFPEMHRDIWILGECIVGWK